MGRGQLSIDVIFAFTLITLTVLSLVSLASRQVESAELTDKTSKLKVFAIDLRDTVTKVYSSGPGFSVKKTVPMNLRAGDKITVVLNSTSGRLDVSAVIGGEHYRVYQNLPVPLVATTNVTLNSTSPDLWVYATYNQTAGAIDVRVKK
ncbi:hypothetical protein, conserved [Thermococcus kodakarensis KOD1]|uniref:Class III signal peptide-containing protein n=1 Tax=Thermococcus kodakarensis (strain ATCC BAA-918 / JCM 12380 / KOD1) TaxID=69014 RepID=Q5JIV3_THEKO|nr:hypothetical protein [Thermococcus kodakarensis]WCN27591.1 hypothetical protein POG15_08485 [Thermococcus kodakarensis]WCN29881.1 hypothetical protein POG21_08470 [Thermococcus kodakarensis]BAD85855.1 hypothetical protein, conserved [Thermococcus kodakarensis KOD1]